MYGLAQCAIPAKHLDEGFAKALRKHGSIVIGNYVYRENNNAIQNGQNVYIFNVQREPRNIYDQDSSVDPRVIDYIGKLIFT